MSLFLFYVLPLILGALHAASFAPEPMGWLQILTLTGVLALLRIAPRPARVMWAFGSAWFVAGLYWLHFSIHDVGGLPFAASAALVLLLAVALSGFYALAIYVWARWRGASRSEVFDLCIAFPLFWLAAELARGYVFFGGFPWLASGYAQVDNPLLKGWFAVLGVYGVGLFSAFFAGVLLSLIVSLRRRVRATQAQLAAALTGVLSVAVVGLILQGVSWGSNLGAPVRVRIVQPNVPQNLKFDADQMRSNTQKFIQQAIDSTAQLTVFPETALPYSWGQLPSEMLQPLQNSLTQQRAVLMGSIGEDAKGYYNSAMWLDGQVDMRHPPRYDKNHLLPMGESIPFGFKWLIEAMNIPLGGYEAGDGYQPFVLQTAQGAVRISANICYENEFGEELIQAWQNGDDAAPHIWVNMTNLGWFGTHDISTNQAQHLQMSRARAMEMARPMIVATNTGTSAHIDETGRVVDVLPADQAASVEVSVQPRQGMTPYIALGNAPLLALLSLIVGVMVLRRHRQVDI